MRPERNRRPHHSSKLSPSHPSTGSPHSAPKQPSVSEGHVTGRMHPFTLSSLALKVDPHACDELPPAPAPCGQSLVKTAQCGIKSIVPLDNPTDLISKTVKTFRVLEVTLSAEKGKYVNPYLDGPWVKAIFKQVALTDGSAPQQANVIICWGFWDGAEQWKVRFAPTSEGVWSIETFSNDCCLHGCMDMITAVGHSEEDLRDNPLRNGFLTRAGRAWTLGDSTAFLPVGDTQWTFIEEFTMEEFKGWMDALKEHGLNSVLGSAWLRNVTIQKPTKGSDYNRIGGLQPFLGKHTFEHPEIGNLQTAYFKEMDARVQYANEQGIVVGICIGGFPGNSSWWKTLFKRVIDDQRWFRYIVDRYAAFNVRWMLYGEVEEGAVETNPNDGQITSDSSPPCKKVHWYDMVDKQIKLIRDRDPYHHPIGSHSLKVDTHSLGEVDYIVMQIDKPGERTESQFNLVGKYFARGKPIWAEEYWYEIKGESAEIGIRNTYRNFISYLGFPTFGSLMRQHSIGAGSSNFVPTKAHGDVKAYLQAHDRGLGYMANFAQFCHTLLELGGDPKQFTHLFAKQNSNVNEQYAGRFGHDEATAVYAVYARNQQAGQPLDVKLSIHAASTNDFEVKALSPFRNGSTTFTNYSFHKGELTLRIGAKDEKVLLIRKKPV